MESFSLLKYWRTTSTSSTPTTITNSRATTPNTILNAAVSPHSSSDDDEEGPYFDLEFSLQENNNEKEAENFQENETEFSIDSSSLTEEEELEQAEAELKLTIESNECTEDDEDVKISASDELFFNGNLQVTTSEENSNKVPVVSLLKSATKFRVLLLKLKKSKSGNNNNGRAEKNSNEPTKSHQQQQQSKQSGKFFTVKLKVEEVKAPIVSYFTRDNSSKHQQNHCKGMVKKEELSSSDDQKIKLTKEVVQKYLNMVKPLYVRVSKRYVEKLKFSGSKSGGSAVVPPPDATAAAEEVTSCVRTNLKQGNSNLQAGFKVVRRHLGKSRSASANVVAAKAVSERRDESLLQVQDGIQGAILHCKRSFNGSRDGESSSVLCL